MNMTDDQKYEYGSLNIPAAGKCKPEGDRVSTCFQEKRRPLTPPHVKKYREGVLPKPGAVRVHPAKANDPDIASTLVHGISTKGSLPAGAVIYAPRKTLYQEKIQEVKESVYDSHKKAPLGRAQDKDPALSACYDHTTTFGAKTIREVGMRELINPPKTIEEVEEEALEGHEAYIHSHNSYFVGEQIDRKYDWGLHGKDSWFGKATPHFTDGRSLNRTLHWLGETCKYYNSKAAWKRSGSKDKLAAQIYNVNVNGKKLHFPPDHTFGLILPLDEFGLGETIHSTQSREYVRDPDRQRSLVNAVRHHLKQANFTLFPTLLEAFKYYDKKGKGMIDKEDLLEVCKEFQLDVNESVLNDLMVFCDLDQDGLINFLEFANFLNWKDKQPITRQDQRILTNELQIRPALDGTESGILFQLQQLPPHEAFISAKDLEPIHPESSLRTVRTLRRLKSAPDHFKTSSSVIGTTKDTFNADARPSGVPSVRFDLPVPRLKRVSDTITYGDTPTVGELMQPTVHDLRGIHEEHLFCSRTKEEIAKIFKNIGVDLPKETFEEAWKLASTKQPNSEVCVEVFHDVLKEIKLM